MRSYSKTGWFMKFGDDSDEQFNTFCGPNNIHEAQCPNCHKPLLKFTLLNSLEFNLDSLMVPCPAIPLFYCWTCDIAQSPFFYKLLPNSQIELVSYLRSISYTDFPYENYPIFFPQKKINFVQLTELDQQTINDVNSEMLNEVKVRQSNLELASPRSQLGGIPYLIQKNPDLELKCPVCAQSMLFVASITDDIQNGYLFTNELSEVQVLYFYCKTCCIVGCFHQTD